MSGEPGKKETVIFIHSRLDDYGLRTPVFRVYCHLARRTGASGAYPAIASIARVCRLHPQTVRHALRVLLQHWLITREPRPGTTPIYRLTPASTWQPPTQIDGAALYDTDASPSLSARALTRAMQGQSPQSDGAEGNPIEGNPKKESPHSPPKGDSVKHPGSTSPLEEEIYAAYPKKVGKPAALRAIRRALAKWPSEYVLERTRLYAQTCNSPVQFIPHPSTWFNQARFDDDPATWRRPEGGIAKAPPAIVRSSQFGQGITEL